MLIGIQVLHSVEGRVAMQLVDMVTHLFPCITGHSYPVRILICGYSIVFSAGKRATASRWGSQLGLGLGPAIHIDWLGQRGMRCAQLLPTLADYLHANPTPDVLIVHLGENDLCTGMSVDLRFTASMTSPRSRDGFLTA